MSPIDLANLVGVVGLAVIGLGLGFCSWLYYMLMNEPNNREQTSLDHMAFSTFTLSSIGCLVAAVIMAWSSWG